MTLDNAIEIVTAVCRKAVGTLDDHNAIQSALKVVLEAARPDEAEVESNGRVVETVEP